jgi:hypothetical protein
MKGVLGSLGSSCQYKRFLSCLGRSSQPRTISSAYTISLHLIPSPSKLGRQSCRVAYLLICVSALSPNPPPPTPMQPPIFSQATHLSLPILPSLAQIFKLELRKRLCKKGKKALGLKHATIFFPSKFLSGLSSDERCKTEKSSFSIRPCTIFLIFSPLK